MKTKIVISPSNTKAIAFLDALKKKKDEIRTSIEQGETFLMLQNQIKKM